MLASGYRFVCLFVFFKQKTAYEMRISDWSSDVCSSDLEGIVLDELNTSYEAGVGSDRYTVPHAVLRPGEHFDGYAVAQWVEAVDEMRREDGVVLTTQRDHV